MDKWEYMTMVYAPHALLDQLNKLGAKGWELVGFVPMAMMPRPIRTSDKDETENWIAHSFFLVFKRRKE